MRSKIKHLKISIDEAIKFQVLNSLNSSFAQFLGILSHKAREKAKLPIFESLTKLFQKEELWMKNQDEATANYAKQFSSKKNKLLTKPEDVEDFTISLSSRCKLYGKKHGLNKYWLLQVECHYCHETGHIAKFCKKKRFLQSSSRQVVTYIQTISSFPTLLKVKALVSDILNVKFPKSSVQKVIIDSGAADHFFSNRAYFSTYKEHHHEFQTTYGEVLTAHGYGNVILYLAHSNGLEVIWTIKKVS